MFNYVLPDGGEPFAFFENTGVLVVNGSLNREKQDRYSFLVKREAFAKISHCFSWYLLLDRKRLNDFHQLCAVNVRVTKKNQQSS